MSAAEQERTSTAVAQAEPQESPPPLGEEIHVPGPSLLPLVTAIGITLAVVGITTIIELSILGCIITAICVYRWIKTTNEDIDELPASEHH
ncbi:MAG TPA: hypothetical protein VKU89_09180 [Solirubrobacteraceae bacterium]|nr:hypothetical protein [Solirubrobacteraceae bacterium]